METRVKFFLLVAVFSLLSGGCQTSVKLSAGRNERPIVCLGDSITSGWDISENNKDDKSRAFPAVIQKLADITVINAGVSGDTTTEALKRLEPDVLAHNPQMVIILLGVNDFFSDFDFQITKENFCSMVSVITAGGSKIFIVKFLSDDAIRWNMFHKGKSETEQEYFISQYYEMYDCLHGMYNCEILYDILDDILPDMTVDGIHPDAIGHEIIGERIYGAIKPWLN